MLPTMTEARFRGLARPHILRCRSGDWRHALRVVRWVKRLGNGRPDLPLLVIAGYIHDIGWRDVLPAKKITFDQLLHYEQRANKNSEPFITEFLSDLGFPKNDIRKVTRLVSAADTHHASRADEAILTDADQLSKLSIGHVREKYQVSEWRRMAAMWQKEFPRRIATDEGKRIWLAEWRKLDRALRREGR